jgi:vancomycin resistance protein VanJ
MGLGSGLDTILPWVALPLPPLVLAAVALRSRMGLVCLVITATLWSVMFMPALTQAAPGGRSDLRVATLNLSADNPDPAASLVDVSDIGPDVIALQELIPTHLAAATEVLGAAGYWYHAVAGTVGLWSRMPIIDTGPVDVGIGWTRALRVTIKVSGREVRVYVAHLSSARPGDTADRDHTLVALVELLRADPAPRLVLAGDLNTATNDRRFALLAPLRDTQIDAGAGFGFTWPAALPVIRPDHILQRGLIARSSRVTRAGVSDHRAAYADLGLDAVPTG